MSSSHSIVIAFGLPTSRWSLRYSAINITTRQSKWCSRVFFSLDFFLSLGLIPLFSSPHRWFPFLWILKDGDPDVWRRSLWSLIQSDSRGSVPFLNWFLDMKIKTIVCDSSRCFFGDFLPDFVWFCVWKSLGNRDCLISSWKGCHEVPIPSVKDWFLEDEDQDDSLRPGWRFVISVSWPTWDGKCP